MGSGEPKKQKRMSFIKEKGSMSLWERTVDSFYDFRLWIVDRFLSIAVLYFVLSIMTVLAFAWANYNGVFKGNTIIIENAHAAGVEGGEEFVAKRDLIDEIFLKESSRGKKNYSKCAEVGKFNRYGYGIPGNGDYVCFDEGDDRKAAEGRVLYLQALGYSDDQVLCLYNSGKAADDCPYLNIGK